MIATKGSVGRDEADLSFFSLHAQGMWAAAKVLDVETSARSAHAKPDWLIFIHDSGRPLVRRV